MDGADSLGQPVRLQLEVVRRTIVVAVALCLVFAFVLWLAPEKDGRETVFDPRPETHAASNTVKTGSPAARRDATDGAPPASDARTSGGPTPEDGSSQGGSDGAGDLERLPPRPPLSDEELRPDTPQPRLLARPIALDGGRIAYRQGVIVLPGVLAVPLTERCGPKTLNYPCGVMARTELRRFLRGRSIACDVPEDFGLKRGEATSACTVGDEDIGRWSVENGWAKSEPGGPYDEAQASAKEARRGIWRE